jgi:hypothetical protein
MINDFEDFCTWMYVIVCTQKMSEKEGEPSGKIGLTKNHKKPGGSRWSLAQNR